MSFTTVAAVNTPNRSPLMRAMNEKRRHRRVSLSLTGRFMAEDQEEHRCRVTNISAGGVCIETNQVVGDNERVIAYVDEIGRIEGHVVRRFDGGFAIELSITSARREKLVAALTWLMNKDLLDPSDERRHMRSEPEIRDMMMELPNGGLLQCRIMDVSISGASLATEARPEIGTAVRLGKLNAKIVRHHEQGVGIEFLDMQHPNALKRSFL